MRLIFVSRLSAMLHWIGLNRITSGLGVLLFAIILTQIELTEVARVLGRISMTGVLAAIALCTVFLIFRAARWWYLLRSRGVLIPFQEAASVSTDAILWGTLTPGRLGEFKRSFHLRRRFGWGVARSLAFGLLDRFFDLLITLLVLLLSLGFLRVEQHFITAGWILAPYMLLVMLFVLRAPLISKLTHLTQKLGRSGAILADMLLDLKELRPIQIVIATLFSFACKVCYIAIIAVLSWPLGLELGIVDVAFCVALTMLAGILPITIFNLGTRELVLVAVLSLYGHSASEAVAFSMVFIICYLVVILTSATMLIPHKAWLLPRPAAGEESP